MYFPRVYTTPMIDSLFYVSCLFSIALFSFSFIRCFFFFDLQSVCLLNFLDNIYFRRYSKKEEVRPWMFVAYQSSVSRTTVSFILKWCLSDVLSLADVYNTSLQLSYGRVLLWNHRQGDLFSWESLIVFDESQDFSCPNKRMVLSTQNSTSN